MKSFRDITLELPSIESHLKNHSVYWAHLSSDKSPELLQEHLQLVLDYFLKLTEVHGLDQAVNNIITNITSVRDARERDFFASLIKELFLAIIPFHDFGKINENFQRDKMNNHAHFEHNKKNPFQTGHSRLSAILYTGYYLDKISKATLENSTKARLAVIVIDFAYNILRHHASALREPTKAFLELEALSLFRYAKDYMVQLQIHCDDKVFESLTIHLDEWATDIHPKEDEFEVYTLLKLNYSLLTASDYLATSHYMMNWPEHISDFGVLTIDQKQAITSSIRSTKAFNKNLFLQYGTYKECPPEQLNNRNNENLNVLRQKMAINVMERLKETKNERLFYIECPTGGGKTNLSILALNHFLQRDLSNSSNDVSKVFYVFPFTTLITQTAKVLKETLNLTSEDMVELHSRASFQGKEEESDDGVYGIKRLNYIDYLFNHYSVTLLSHVKFFDILKTSFKESNYLFHRLANSLVIIDELQSYNPKEWDKVIYFLSRLAPLFNIRFILMSATLPKIDQLSTSRHEFTNLINNARNDYFKNPNFKDRVVFNFDLLKRKNMTLDELADIVIEKSEEYSKTNTENSNGVKTVIEFIYKKTASQFYEVIRRNAGYLLFDDIFVLSGTILEPRRREIITYLKSPENFTKRILLISTQVVEAGIDIDMDIGFKDRSLIDSDEQLAGRINRNAFKSDSHLYLFSYDKSHVIYGKDIRYKVTNDEISHEEYIDILQNKEFDRLYDKVTHKINVWNKTAFAVNFSEYRQAIKALNFTEADFKFKLIDDNSISVFVPCQIPLKVSISGEHNFSNTEIEMLKTHGIHTNGDTVDGAAVWKLYEELVTNRGNDFISRMIYLKMIGAIMSKFVFSASNSMLMELANTFGEIKYGFFYFSNFADVYDYYYGINDSKLKDSNFI